MKAKTQYQPIENYGVIGDLRTVALVGINGSIDFLCFPNFDSPSVFAKLLDKDKGGFFQIIPAKEDVKAKQLYLPDTNILLTRFLFEDGIGEITDFMPVYAFCKSNIVVRKVTNIKGKITYRMFCCPRFNYAGSSHKANIHNKEILFTSEGKDKTRLKLKSSVDLSIKNGDGFAEFTLQPGEEAVFILENIQEDEMKLDSNYKNFVAHAFKETHHYWKTWASKATYSGRWREMVIRSALALKLLISEKYGSIIAAPTFSLPEKIGGEKNWDYRFAWIRDAAFTVYSLMILGYTEEAKGFTNWVEMLSENLDKNTPLKPLYGFDGKKQLEEKELNYLEGYRKSSPVRIGNAAKNQFQIDIYGEFIDSIYLYDKYVMAISHDAWINLSNQINWLVKNWKRKGCGIWEIRGKMQEFLYSRFMSWVAIDRMIRIGNRHSFPYPDTWIKTRNDIYNSVFRDFWDEKRQTFVQFKNSKGLDASTLLMPLRKFISPKDPRWLSTLKCIEEDLAVDCLVYRYKPDDAGLFGLKKGEGSFGACSFWYIECLSRAGQLEKAEIYFDKMLSYSNHVGLYSEQFGGQGEHLGNFPQAFTHLALISAAFDLNKRFEN